MANEIVLFQEGSQMALLFEKDETNIRKHINNIFKSEEVDKNNNTHFMRVDGVKTICGILFSRCNFISKLPCKIFAWNSI